MQREPIAIIGQGCRFPGGAVSSSKLWELLSQPRDVLSPIPAERFDPNAFYHPDGQYHGSTNVQHSYLLEEDIARFDAPFFGIKPIEAMAIDPQQRLLLETVYESLESAGIPVEALRGSKTACYVGLMCGDYEHLSLRDFDTMPTYHATGTARSLMSSRISYVFDWRGPSMTIDTACSSSLVAVHQAVQALRSGEATVAIAAGSNLLLGPEHYIMESKLKMLSPSGRCRMWDEGADGYGRGEGVAAVVLKTLSAAVRDGDDIECIIRETGVNQDGKTQGITMPSSQAQAALIRDTYAKAGLDPRNENERCQFFEAHGTGTQAGDPIEAEAICDVFFGVQSAPSGGSLHVGSIKTLIGHTEGTAGLAGVIKASLALRSGIIPPNMLFERLNPALRPFCKNLTVPQMTEQWPTLAQGSPRRVSVNSFGFGGTNAHAILESYDGQKEPMPRYEGKLFSPFVFSAYSQLSLKSMILDYVSLIEQQTEGDVTSLRALSRTLSTRRSEFPYRLAVSASSAEMLSQELRTAAQELAQSTMTPNAAIGSGKPAKLLGIFTGQGAQWPQMGQELLLHSEFARDRISQLQARLDSLPDGPSWSIASELMADAHSSHLSEAVYAQTLCTVVQIILVDLLSRSNVQLHTVVGHSGGETAAAYAAGYISAEDAVCIAYYRGLHMHLAKGPQGQKGGMIAVGTSMEDAQEICDTLENRISIAACNSPSSITLSGDLDAINEAKDVFDDEKKFNRLLKVDTAYHSHHVGRVSEAYLTSLRSLGIKVREPSSTAPVWFSSVYVDRSSKFISRFTAEYWNDNVTRTVMFSQALAEALKNETALDFTLEIGPHSALKGPALQVMEDVLGKNLPYFGLLHRGQSDITAVANACGALWTHCGPESINLGELEKTLSGCAEDLPLKGLPTYAWDHQNRYWHESRYSKAIRTRTTPVHELLGHKTHDSSKWQMQWRHLLRPKEVSWLHGHCLQDQMVFPAAGYVVTILEAALDLANGSPVELFSVHEFVILQAMAFENDSAEREILVTLSNIRRPDDKMISADFAYHSATSETPDMTTLMAKGRMELCLGEPNISALPFRTIKEANMINVETDMFYSSLAEIGYQYTGPFRALSALKRKIGVASGSITNYGDPEAMHRLLLHPAVLDAAFSAVMLAFSFPRDGELWAIHVPTSIESVKVNVSLLQDVGAQELLQFDSSAKVQNLGMYGNVSVYGEKGGHALLQVDGMHAVPLSPAAPQNDSLVFSKKVWGLASPDGEDASEGDNATKLEYEIAELAERVAYYYQRNLDREIANDHPARSEGPYVHLFGFINTVHELVISGKHRYLKRDAQFQTYEDVIPLSKRLYPDDINFTLLHIVGENMPAVIRGETTILEHLLVDDALTKYYTNALGVKASNSHLGRMISQLAHRYPHLHILEIGAGTGSASESALTHLNGNFSSYTYTDISPGFFEKAQERFSRHGNLTFKVLDVEKDVVAQGFTDSSYDLIIASLVLHATKDLEQTLTRVRRLLKPGGFLLLLEITNNDQIRVGSIFGSLPGWWLGAEDGRAFSPCISTAEWDVVLRKTGFSGVDTVTSEMDALPRPTSVICSQAVDDTIMGLREPLAAADDVFGSGQELILIGGRTLKTSKPIGVLRSLLRRNFDVVTCLPNVEALVSSGMAPGATVLNLSELDAPIFKDLSTPRLEGLKMLFELSKIVLWVTEGAQSQNPYSAMIHGFSRTIIQENNEIRIRILDCDPGEKLGASFLAESLLEFKLGMDLALNDDQDKILWSAETDMVLRDGKCLILRYNPDTVRNNRWNTRKRAVMDDLDLQHDIAEIDYSGPQAYLTEGQVPHSEAGDTVMVKSSHSLPIAIGRGENDSLGLFAVLGIDTESGEQLIVLSKKNASTILVPSENCQKAHVAAGQEAAFLDVYANHFIASATVSSCSKGSILLVHGANASLNTAFSSMAAKAGVKIELTASSSGMVGSKEAKILHPQASCHTVKSMLPENIGTCFIAPCEPKASTLRRTLLKSLPPSCNVLEPSTLLRPDYISPAKIEPHASAAAKEAMNQLSNLQASILLNELPLAQVHGKPTAEIEDRVISWHHDSNVRAKIQQPSFVNLFSPTKTYWLVGLSGDLGLSLAEWMIQCGACSVAISSRNPKVDPAWLTKTKSMGGNIQVFTCDITSRESVCSTHKQILNCMPAIAGVFQAAMVLHDAPLRDMTLDEMRTAVAPKVDGSVHLDELFQEDTLDFFIFFSSLASVLGNYGQSNYAAANSFMTGLAAQRRQKGLAASSIDIGALLGVGYITRKSDRIKLIQDKRAVYAWISEGIFRTAIAEAVRYGRSESTCAPEIITGVTKIKPTSSDLLAVFRNPVFSHFIIKDSMSEQDGPTKSTQVSLRTQLQEVTQVDELFMLMASSFASKLGTLLHSEIQLDTMMTLAADQLGIDSLVAVEVRAYLLKMFQVNIPVLKILGGAKIKDMLTFVLENIPAEVTPNLIQKDGDSIRSAAEKPFDAPNPQLQQSTNVMQRSSLDSSISSEDLSSSELVHSSSEGGVSSATSEVCAPASTQTPSLMETDLEPCLERIAPMSYLQSTFWFLDQYLEEKSSLNTTARCKLTGRVDATCLSQALQKVVQRHESLRTLFYNEEGQLMQGVLEKTPDLLYSKRVTSNEQVLEEFEDMKRHHFDISRGQVMKVLLLSQTSTLHFLVVGWHHISVDGMSSQVFLNDLTKAYTGLPLGESVLQYPDFATQQRIDCTNGSLDKELVFWKSEFSTLPSTLPILPISGHSSRGILKTYKVHTASVQLDARRVASVKAAARELQITPFQFYLTTLEILLHRWLGLTDICIGMGDGGRYDESMFDGIGCFMNILPLYLHLQPDHTIEHVAAATKTKVHRAMENSRVPFEVLLDQLGVSRSSTHSPLFQVFINFRRAPAPKFTFGNCVFEIMATKGVETSYDVSLDIDEHDNGSTCIKLMGQTSLYSQENVNLLLGNFTELLDAFVTNTKQKISELELFPAHRVQAAIKAGKGPEILSKWPDTISHRIMDICAQYANDVAVSTIDEPPLTYGELHSRVQAIASRIRPDVKPGSAVSIFQEPSSNYVCSLLAVLEVGGVYVPMDMALPMARLAFMIKDCGAFVILTDDKTARNVPSLGLSAITVINVSPIPTPTLALQGYPQNKSKAKDAAAIFYTSGSTGNPKGIKLLHSNLRNALEYPAYPVERETILQHSALGFDMSLHQILLALCHGGHLFMAPRVLRGDAVELAALIVREKITTTIATPSEYLSILRFGNSSDLQSSYWRFAATGGECFSTALMQQFRMLEKPGLRLFNAYGPTEGTFCSNVGEVHYNDDNLANAPISVGRSLPNSSILIVDDACRPVPCGVPGEVVIGGAGVAFGYLGHKQLNEKVFVHDYHASDQFSSQGWTTMHRTGDRGLLSSDGILTIKGRMAGSTQIKLRGIRIDLCEIERAILQCSDGMISDAVVVQHNSADSHSTILVAYVIMSSADRSTETEHCLKKLQLALDLPTYMSPARLIAVDEFPRMGSGKADRQAISKFTLPQQATGMLAKSGSLTEGESLVKSLWERTISDQLTRDILIEPETDFFHAGGNSALLVRLQSLIQAVRGCQIPLHSLFEHSTLAKMAALLDKQTPSLSVSLTDWDAETQLDESLLGNAKTTGLGNARRKPRVVVLTGATGLLGKKLLQRIHEADDVEQVHCIAVRSKISSPLNRAFPKGAFHYGRLDLPRLGLEESTASQIFSKADLIIHCAAEVSHMKAYATLRAANFQSTKELVALAIGRKIPMHFISSAGVGMTLHQPELYEESLADALPASDVKDGYNLSKWASEKYLERVSEAFGTEVYIHRPVSILREGGMSNGSDKDILQSIVKYSTLAKAVPLVPNVKGSMSFVPVDRVAEDIVRAAGIHGARAGNVEQRVAFMNHVGDISIEYSKLAESLEETTGDKIQELEVNDWLDETRPLGLDNMVANFLVQAEQVEAHHLPEVLKGSRLD